MNRINEIGDTPRGQYMLGRLSQRYDEPNLYTDDYDEVPEIADYASRNWRKDGNARAFDLGKGDEANTKWVDDGNQRNFRKMNNLPQFENKQNNRIDMNKKLIRLTEQDLHRIVKESVNKVLKEEKPPFIDSELAMGNHDNAAFHRFNLVLDNFARDLIGWIKDEGYKDKIDMGFMPKIMQTIREVLSEYGLPSK